jgi:hypothetical protein
VERIDHFDDFGLLKIWRVVKILVYKKREGAHLGDPSGQPLA